MTVEQFPPSDDADARREELEAQRRQTAVDVTEGKDGAVEQFEFIEGEIDRLARDDELERLAEEGRTERAAAEASATAALKRQAALLKLREFARHRVFLAGVLDERVEAVRKLLQEFEAVGVVMDHLANEAGEPGNFRYSRMDHVPVYIGWRLREGGCGFKNFFPLPHPTFRKPLPELERNLIGQWLDEEETA